MRVSEGLVVITGGTRGIGLATARRLASEGRALLLAYRGDETAAREAESSLAESTAVHLVQADLATEAGVESIFRAADRIGQVQGLVNCAGTLETQAGFDAIDRDRWRRIFEVNVFGTAQCCREAVHRMTATGGAIVNLSSRAAVFGAPREYVDYASSKAAVDAMTRGLALEVADRGIRVNSVRPGIIETALHAAGGEPGRAQRLGPGLPMGRAGDADEVAAAIQWLLSDDASYVTGTTLDVSGGR